MRNLRNAYTTAAACVALGLWACPVQATVITGNGGFEIAGSGGAADSDMWSEFTTAANNVSERTTTNPEFGSYAHHLLAYGQDALGTVAGIQQNSGNDVGLPSLAPGSTLSASFDAMTPFGPGGVMNYTLRILNGAGAIVNIYNNTIPNPSSVYNTYTTTSLIVPAFGAAPNDYYVAFFEINAAAGGFASSVSEIYVDNVSIEGTLVPEPASLALLALGAAAVTRRRR
ncbi:MAG TPA: PEP-CTERM sorting domain-containing protein [Phycisphaerae bacterium]|nr:PEP-CTERM sorting domain-containing protein [Phycisphaerae bacterium]